MNLIRAESHPKAIAITVLLALCFSRAASGADDTRQLHQSNTLSVAVVQMRSSRDLANNVSRICGSIRDGARQGARVIVFPECALTGYFRS